ncbi:MAG: hypothetical protein EOM14_02395 [Clostridia bacterium]|nr:hypothetical protein [Clostridia bacterium]
MPRIKAFCAHKWQNLEPEDRLSEALTILFESIRLTPLNGAEAFWSYYISALCPYMDELNKNAPSLRFPKESSLDKKINWQNETTEMSRYVAIKGSTFDETRCFATDFLLHLKEEERNILIDLLIGKSKKAICTERSMNQSELNSVLDTIGKFFLAQ